MKRFLALLMMTAIIGFSGMAHAGDTVGVYVAPKFAYGLTVMDGMKTKWESDIDMPISTKIGSKTDSAFGGALAIGYDFSRKFDIPIRTELEYSIFSKVDGDKSKSNTGTDFGPSGGGVRDTKWTGKQSFEIQTLFLNAYYDFKTGTSFTPYLGAGLGAAFIDTKGSFKLSDTNTGDVGVSGSTGSKNVTNFAWNIGAGVGYDINENFTVDLGYRFASLGDVKTKWNYDDGGDADFRMKTSNLYMHQVMLGLRMTF